MNTADLDRVLDDMRLADGTVFPMPITLSVDDLTNIEIDRDVATVVFNNFLRPNKCEVFAELM